MANEKVKVVFHKSDLDGMLSGAIIRYYLLEIEGVKDNDIEMIGLDYGIEFDEKKRFNKDDKIYFADFMLQPINRMKYVKNNCKELIILDHHKDAIDNAEKIGIDIIKSSNKYDSACKIVWGHFIDEEMGVPIPKFVELLSDHDTWNKNDINKWDDIVTPFQYAMKADNYMPDTDDGYKNWEDIFVSYFTGDEDEFIDEKITIGKQIYKYQANEFEKQISDRGFDMNIMNNKALCLNTDGKGSGPFMSRWDKNKYDFMFSFGYMGDDKWNLGFYTEKDNIDCCAMAKTVGGGGHNSASGATVDTKTMMKILNDGK